MWLWMGDERELSFEGVKGKGGIEVLWWWVVDGSFWEFKIVFGKGCEVLEKVGRKRMGFEK